MEDILISGGRENQCCAVPFFSKGAEHVAVNWGAEPADAEGLPVYHEDGEPDQRAPVKVQADWIGQEDARQQKLSGMCLFKVKTVEKHLRRKKHQIDTDAPKTKIVSGAGGLNPVFVGKSCCFYSGYYKPTAGNKRELTAKLKNRILIVRLRSGQLF